MKIPRVLLEKMIREELAKHVKDLVESGPGDHRIMDAQEEKSDEEKPEKKGPGRPPGSKNKPKLEPNKEPDNKGEKGKPDRSIGSPDQKPPEQPAEEDPADDELDDEETGEEDADEVTGGEIADELAGKTVQSITMEPKSKIMPGAQEIVITFSQITDPLRILVSKSGGVKFYFKGLHNEL